MRYKTLLKDILIGCVLGVLTGCVLGFLWGCVLLFITRYV